MNRLMTRATLMDDFLKGAATGIFVQPLNGEPLPAQIRVDVKESSAAFTLLAELPGVPKEDIHVTVEGNVVTLRAEVKQAVRQGDGETLLRRERYVGEVSRSLQMPADIDETAAKAKCENGVLQLTLPKKAAVTGQRLTIE